MFSVLLVAAVVLAGIWYLIWGRADPMGLRPEDFPTNAPPEASLKGSSEDKILIIGAGFCGLGIAAAFKRNGIPFESAEANDHVGGNWYNGVYEGVHIISSRKTTEYKDVPMPTSFPDFPSRAQMIQYLTSYCETYKLNEHICFNSRVTLVKPLAVRDTTKGKQLYEVTFENGDKRTYRGVVVANGHHWNKRIPAYPGKFTGEVIHSKDYKVPEVLKGKRVLVVGGGNSACDINAEASRFAAETHCSMRRGYWFLPRTVAGYPLVDLIRPWMPLWFQRIVLWVFVRLSVGYYTSYGLQEPDHKIFEHHPTINSELLHLLKLGRITPHPDIKCFSDMIVEFVDGTKQEIDLIVYATGYTISLPMFEDGVIPYEDGVPQLLGGSYHPTLPYLVVFGILQARYGAGSLITLGAEALAQFILTQDGLKRPIQSYFRKFSLAPPEKKAKQSADVLADPHVLFQKAKGSMFLMKLLPLVERLCTAFNLKID